MKTQTKTKTKPKYRGRAERELGRELSRIKIIVLGQDTAHAERVILDVVEGFKMLRAKRKARMNATWNVDTSQA